MLRCPFRTKQIIWCLRACRLSLAGGALQLEAALQASLHWLAAGGVGRPAALPGHRLLAACDCCSPAAGRTTGQLHEEQFRTNFVCPSVDLCVVRKLLPKTWWVEGAIRVFSVSLCGSSFFDLILYVRLSHA